AIDKEIIAQPPCRALQKWYAALNPAGITVIFPTSFVNNPASTFGHTFLRIDQPGQTEETRPLPYTINYAAAVHGENALSYAVRGIFGGYDGFYSIAPYYKQITQYSDLENRDIWEYQLSHTDEEVRLLVLHLWEIKDIPFSYFYFDENCAYHIAALLD